MSDYFKDVKQKSKYVGHYEKRNYFKEEDINLIEVFSNKCRQTVSVLEYLLPVQSGSEINTLCDGLRNSLFIMSLICDNLDDPDLPLHADNMAIAFKNMRKLRDSEWGCDE